MSKSLGPITQEQRQRFLAALAEGASVSHAAREAGRHRRRFYDLREADEVFREAWREAEQEGTDTLIEEARRRAVEGIVQKERWRDGELVERVRRYSDTLLIFLLKARDPARFNRFEVASQVTGQVELRLEVDEQSVRETLRVLAEQGIVQPGPATATDPEGQ